MMKTIGRAISEYAEATGFGLAALSVLVGIGWMVAYDIAHSRWPDAPTTQASFAATASRQPAPAPVPAPPSTGDRSLASLEKEAHERHDVTNYTLYRTTSVALPDGRKLDVVTGDNFASADAPPQYSYCYIPAGNITENVQHIVNLAKRNGDGETVNVPLEPADAKAVGLTLPMLEKARTDGCQLR